MRFRSLLIAALFVAGSASCTKKNELLDRPYNRLILGERYSGPDDVSVPLLGLSSLDNRSIESLEALRAGRIAQTPELLQGTYRLSSIFAGIVPAVPWISAKDKVVLSQLSSPSGEPGGSITAASLSFNNPMILVRPEFTELMTRPQTKVKWKTAEELGPELAKADFPFVPLPTELRISPRAKRATITYDLSIFARQVAPYVSTYPPVRGMSLALTFQNARDMGFTFARLSRLGATNIETTIPTDAFELKDGYRSLKADDSDEPIRNDESSISEPWHAILLRDLPATIPVDLWSAAPINNEPADLTFEILIR